VAVYSGYTITQLHSLQELQARTIDRNRTDSLLLLRIQNNLNSVALAMRDMLDGTEPYPLTAWRGQFQRIRIDLEDALAQEERTSPLDRGADQRRYLSDSVAQFWDASTVSRPRCQRQRIGGSRSHPPLATGSAGRAQHRRSAAPDSEQRD